MARIKVSEGQTERIAFSFSIQALPKTNFLSSAGSLRKKENKTEKISI